MGCGPIEADAEAFEKAKEEVVDMDSISWDTEYMQTKICKDCKYQSGSGAYAYGPFCFHPKSM